VKAQLEGSTPSGTAPAEQCTLGVADAPLVRGIQLGMTGAAFLKQYGNVRIRNWGLSIQNPDNVGLVTLEFYPDAITRIPRGSKLDFRNLQKVSIDFLDGRITAFTLEYDGSTKWPNVDEFTARVGSTLRLPDSWMTAGEGIIPGDGERVMECKGFNVSASTAVFPSLTFEIPGVMSEVEKRVTDKEALKRRVFKP
jgi:hypothetical protein